MKKSRIITFAQYIIMFCGFALMYFFMLPNSDVFFFSADYKNVLPDLFNNALNYGNGRLLGNFIGFFFSLNFTYAFILLALMLTALVYLVNRLFFNGNPYTAFPVALLVALPSSEMMSEVYFQLPSAVNYVMPMVFILISLCLIKSENALKHKHLYGVLIFIFTTLSCLFSENSTITIFTLAVLYIVYNLIYKNKMVAALYCLAGTVVGGLLMAFLPTLTNSSSNLDYYRGTATTLMTTVTLAIASFSTFADVFSKFFVLIIVISGCMIFLIRNSVVKRKTLKKLVIYYLVFFSIESVFYALLSQNAPSTIYLYIAQLALVILYAASLFIAILMVEKRRIRTLLIELYILMLSAVGPMLFVNQYGYRTFYLSYFVILCIALYLITVIKPKFKELIKINKVTVKRFTASISCMVFICFSALVFMQSVYNYDFYVVRMQYIASQSNEAAEEIHVPFLPCRAISCEEENPTLIQSVLYKKSSSQIKIMSSNSCENSDDYQNILNSNPLSNLIFAVENIEYKNPAFFNSLFEK